MLPYLLVMIIYGYKSQSTVQIPLPDQQTCISYKGVTPNDKESSNSHSIGI